MKVGLVSSRYYVDIVKNIVKQEFDDIDLVPLTYANFAEATELVRRYQSRFDALIFSGRGAFESSAASVSQTVIWRILTRHSDRLLRTLLIASIQGMDITHISCDTYDKTILNEVFKEIGIKNPCIQVYPYGENPTHPTYLDDLIQFHVNNYQSGKANFCITLLNHVYKELSNQGVPCYFALPTYQCVRETLQDVRLRYMAQYNQRSQIVVLMAKIDTPNKYSIIGKDEYQFHADKQIISEHIYRFANKIKAAVLETSYNTYILFSTKHILESETKGFNRIALLDDIEQSALHTVSVGIGYGITASEAKYHAVLAMEKAESIPKCSAYMMAEDGRCYGPLSQEERQQPLQPIIDEKLYRIASNTQLSINRINQLNTIMRRNRQDCFTTKELAAQCNISIRSMDRILNRLEEKGYAELVGRRIVGKTGRPSRIMRLCFDGSNRQNNIRL